MNIIPTFPSIHSQPRYWGADVDTWRPERWIETSHEASAEGSVFEFDSDLGYKNVEAIQISVIEKRKGYETRAFCHLSRENSMGLRNGLGYYMEQ